MHQDINFSIFKATVQVDTDFTMLPLLHYNDSNLMSSKFITNISHEKISVKIFSDKELSDNFLLKFGRVYKNFHR